MWICARCGTEAKQPEVCSGCGSLMRPFNKPADRPSVGYLLTLGWDSESGYEQYVGPFATVMEADQWWEQFGKDDRFSHVRFHEVSIVELPT